MKKYIIGIFLLIFLLGFQGAFAAGTGTCGTNVKYTISGKTISFSRSNTAAAAIWDIDCGEVFKDNSSIEIVNVKDTIRVTDGYELFRGFKYVKEMNLSKLDVSKVEDMGSMFEGLWNDETEQYESSLIRLDVSSWNTANVTNMAWMFAGCSSLTTLDVSNWNTANVMTMNGLFDECRSLTTLDVSRWNTENATDMYYVFENCSALTTLDVSGWNTANVTEMESIFAGCSALTALDVSRWNTARVTNMCNMFSGCRSLTTLDVSRWNTANVTYMCNMFEDCSSLTKLDVSGWNTARVEDMSGIFDSCSSLTKLDVSGWNTARVMYTSYMFEGCSALTTLDVSRWNTGSVTYMSGMFEGCSALKTLNVSGWNTANVMEIDWMFEGCSALTTLDVSRWNTANVTAMQSLFAGCSALKTLDVSRWNTARAVYMCWMFEGCSALTTLDVSRWNTARVEDMTSMFEGCSALTSLDVSGWNTSAVTDMDNVFASCSRLVTLTLGKNTLKKNIFTKLPKYSSTWYYIEPGAAAGKPLSIGSTKQKGALFTSYSYNTMAGTWSADKDKLLETFVSRCYALILERKADAGGLKFYIDQLKAGKLTGAQMVMNFINSPEFQGKKYGNEKVVEILYQTMMGRNADAKGRDYWAGFLNDGLSQKYVVRGFAGSAEFRNICSTYGIKAGTLTLTENRDKNPKVTAFVSRCYRLTLDRAGDANGLNYWTGKILTKALTPQQVADSFVFSKECVDKKLNNTEFVKMLYRLYMGREFDQSGLDFWLGKMKNGMSRQTVAKSFGGSKEFRNIVASYGL